MIFNINSTRGQTRFLTCVARVTCLVQQNPCRTTTLTNDHPSHTTTFRVTDSAFCLYTNPSRATIPLIRPHQCDSEGGRIRGVLLYHIISTEALGFL